MTPRSARRPFRTAAATGLVALTLALAACGGGGPAATGQPTADVPTPAAGTTPAEGDAPPATVGRTGASRRITFVPDRVVLPGGAAAPVQPAVTRDGELVVPENVQHVGWWDGSARAGDAFGNTVIAGHVDSATDGLGFFARLLDAKKGETVTLQGPDSRHLAYTITSVRTIKKDALATGSAAFDQTGDPHLVLITCGGTYRKDSGGYDSNVVVTAKPKGLAR